jgi:hypothetical protein
MKNPAAMTTTLFPTPGGAAAARETQCSRGGNVVCAPLLIVEWAAIKTMGASSEPWRRGKGRVRSMEEGQGLSMEEKEGLKERKVRVGVSHNICVDHRKQRGLEVTKLLLLLGKGWEEERSTEEGPCLNMECKARVKVSHNLGGEIGG